MAIISVFSAFFSRAEDITNRISEISGWPLIENHIFEKAGDRYGTPREKLERAMTGPPFHFNKFTHRRERYLAQLKTVLADMLADNQILHGFASHLIPQQVGHVLRVCLVSDPEQRVKLLAQEQNINLEAAQRRVQKEDLKRAQWTRTLFGKQPWDTTLYDLKVPVHLMGVDEAAKLVVDNAGRDVMRQTAESKQALRDFAIAARAEQALIAARFFYSVSCLGGVLTVVVDEFVIRFEKLETELKSLLHGLDGVRDVEVMTGPNFRPTSVLTPFDFELPDKVLLVDDEQDFVLTLSERLEMRDLEPVVVFSGEEALAVLEEEEPDVMVLDLKMPGIDGIEVLKRVAAEHPGVKIIVLTGHGSEKDRALCLELGAFAYLEKPVDIEVLADTMHRAKESAGDGVPGDD
jgi:CheY-like chemotaxis protein/cytidylate kinase